jgi:hypothetical protein
MVRIAVRSAFVLFAWMFMKTEPLPVPLSPDVTVIHDAVLVVVHVQPAPAVTVMPLKAIPGVRAIDVGDNDTVHPEAACCTENCRPPIVRLAVLAAPVFAVIA